MRELEREALALAEDGYLLKAHQQLAELEASRDSLLQRQHGHGSSAANIRLIRHYFAGTETLAGKIGMFTFYTRQTLAYLLVEESFLFF